MPNILNQNLSNIYLVGPMGAGKTTIGRHLAEMLGRSFVDSDHEIERKTGASIPWIFEKEGEIGFRGRETATLQELCVQSNLVVATGGGVVTQRVNRQLLQRNGVVIYLYTPVEIQLQRTHRDRNRPLLQVENPEQKLRELFEVRDPLYREVADYIIETHQGEPRHLAGKIVNMVMGKDYLSKQKSYF